MKIFTIKLALLLGISQITAQSPGGVKGAAFWYKTTAKDENAVIYKDYSSYNHTIKTEKATYNPTLSWYNFNESSSFDGKRNYLEIPFTMEDVHNLVFFTVVKDMDNKEERNIYQTKEANKKSISFSNRNVFHAGDLLTYGADQKVGAAFLNTFVHFGLPAKAISSVIGGKDQTILYIGKENKELKQKPYKGQLPEFIIYKQALTRTEKLRVESYLAIKYGLTLPQDQDYLNSRNETIWDSSENKNYSNNITGIGRDNASALHQKQSTSSNEPLRFTLSAGKLQANNKENTSEINNLNFLVWGDNGKSFIFSDKQSDQELSFINRVWRMQATGKGIKELSTQVQLQVKDILDSQPLQKDETLWLVINPENKEDFSADSPKLIYKDMENIDAEGRALYKDIYWQEEGKSIFSFAKGPDMLLNLSLTEPSCRKPTGNSDIKIVGGRAPYKIQLQAHKTGQSQAYTISQTEVNVSDLKADEYQLTITDARNRSRQRTFSLYEEGNIRVDLGEDKTLMEGQNLVLDASEKVKDSQATYFWSSDNGFRSTEPQVKINRPGNYQVQVTSSEGCTTLGKIKIKDPNTDIGIYITPIPALLEEGIHIIAKLEKQVDIKVALYDMSGRLLRTQKETGNSQYDFHLPVASKGTYMVIIEAGEQTLKQKVTVK